MAIEKGEPEVESASAASAAGTPDSKASDPVLSAFADLVGDLALDLARGTLGPAVQGMHDEWRSEAALFRRDTAEWVARVNSSRQHLEQVVERQQELAREVYDSHSKLLQDMAAFQKERLDARQWQEQVTTGLSRLNEVQRELAVETTRMAGVVRDIIGELARYQTDLEKRFSQFEERLLSALKEQADNTGRLLKAAAESMEEAMEALSKTNEETRSVLARDITALRREVQEVATRVGRDITENRAVLQQNIEQRLNHFEQQTRSRVNRTLGLLALGEVLLLGGVGYLIMQLVLK